MEVGVGLPTTTPGTDGQVIVEWARRADGGPFASVGVLDRVVYRSVEPFLALAAAAAVSSRVRLVTMVVIGPLRNTVLLAKQAASLDLLSGGRLTLGLAIGARDDDYRVTGVRSDDRGRRLADQLVELRSTWEKAEVGPEPERPGRPALWGQGYFALGDADAGGAYLRDYYAFTGPFAERIAAGNLTSARAVRDFVRGYQEAGCDHLVLLPTVSDPAQLDRLADVLA